MKTSYESFWQNASFAFVGHKEKKNFPELSFSALKAWDDKRVYAVDPSMDVIQGQRVYHDLASLPETVDAVVLEVPQDETRDWVQMASDAGIKNLWIHMNRDTPEAVALAESLGMNVWQGTCAVMYVKRGFSGHSIHKWINKALGKY